jgi:serine/threonine protein kinase
LIGISLQKRYSLEAELGRGGMGVVYRARDRLLDRDVAIKVLSDLGLGSEGRARLLREAQSAAQLNHPNIVTVYDAGEHEGSPASLWSWWTGYRSTSNRPRSWVTSWPSPAKCAPLWSMPTHVVSCIVT